MGNSQLQDGEVFTKFKTGANNPNAPTPIVVDHGALGGLSDDDHPQYAKTSTLEATVRSTVLTGFTVGDSSDVIASDSILAAFGKLQSQLDGFDVLGSVLTGYASGGNSALVDTDTILQAFGKLQAQVSGFAGMAIGGTIGGSPTAGSVLFVGAEGVLAEDWTHFRRILNGHGYTILARPTAEDTPSMELSGAPGIGTGGYILFTRSGYGTDNELNQRGVNGEIGGDSYGNLTIGAAGATIFARYPNSNSIYINTHDAHLDYTARILLGTPAKVGLLIRGASSQSANLAEWRNNTDVLMACVTKDGYFRPGDQSTNWFGIEYRAYSVHSNYGTILEFDPGNSRINNPLNLGLTFDYLDGLGGYSVVLRAASGNANDRLAVGYGTLRVGTTLNAGDGGTLAFDNLTPAQITADQDDYDLTNLVSKSKYLRVSTDALRNVTGLKIGQVDGQEHVLINVGANTLVMRHQNASSLAVNRFLNSTGADVTLAPNESADLVYDGTTARWRVSKRN